MWYLDTKATAPKRKIFLAKLLWEKVTATDEKDWRVTELKAYRFNWDLYVTNYSRYKKNRSNGLDTN